jgi:hypothetical protein
MIAPLPKGPAVRILALFAALAVAAVAACSGSGSAVAPNIAPSSSPTPSPSPLPSQSPTPTPTPIQLVVGGTTGTTMGWPDGDTPTGGQGQPVDGINCQNELLGTFHHHVHLSVFVNGTQYWIPRGVGMFHPSAGNKTGYIYHAQCFYWLHAHDRTGIIHIEPPSSLAFTLKNWFDLWGEPLSATEVAGYTGNVAVYVNGMLQPGVDPNTVQFSPFEEITLVIGTPPSWIPAYTFPPGYP